MLNWCKIWKHEYPHSINVIVECHELTLHCMSVTFFLLCPARVMRRSMASWVMGAGVNLSPVISARVLKLRHRWVSAKFLVVPNVELQSYLLGLWDVVGNRTMSPPTLNLRDAYQVSSSKHPTISASPDSYNVPKSQQVTLQLIVQIMVFGWEPPET